MVTGEKPLRILHIMSGFGGGISSFIMNKAKEMPKYHVIFDVATYDDCNTEFITAIAQTGGEIFKLSNPKKTSWKQFKKSFLAPFDKNTYDIVHCHIAGYRAIPYALLTKRYSSSQFYIHAHLVYTDDNGIPKKGMNHKLNQWVNHGLTKEIVGCGHKAIQSIFGTYSAANVLPNSIDEQAFNLTENDYNQFREKGRKKYNINDKTLVVGHIGRLLPVKNHKKTLEMVEYVKKENLDIKFLILGSGALEESLKNTVREKDLQDYIIFTGRISPISEFLPVLDACVLPSLTEGLPTTVVETQAAGLPIVMSDVITDEVDLGLGLVSEVRLNASAQTWVQELIRIADTKVPEIEKRLAILDKAGYSNHAAGEIYYSFFHNQVIGVEED